MLNFFKKRWNFIEKFQNLLKNDEINRLPAQGNDLNRLIVQRYTTKYDYKRQYETLLDWEGGFRLCCDLLIRGEGWL